MSRSKPDSICRHCDGEFAGKREYCSDRCRKLSECQAKGTTKFLKTVVAPLFQKMIRAEYAAKPEGYTLAIGKDGKIGPVYRHLGVCVCVTCGKKDCWNSGIKGMHTGHFISSRRASILLEEDNVAPQCSNCNFYRNGAASEFRSWMMEVRGPSAIERLEKLKTESVSFSREELVDRWFRYSHRLKMAKEEMER